MLVAVFLPLLVLMLVRVPIYPVRLRLLRLLTSLFLLLLFDKHARAQSTVSVASIPRAIVFEVDRGNRMVRHSWPGSNPIFVRIEHIDFELLNLIIRCSWPL